jgi:hypothetical protein
MKRQILRVLLTGGIGAFLATGCCCPKPVAVVKKTEVLTPTGPVIVSSKYPVRTNEVVIVQPTPAPKPDETLWYFTGIRWVRVSGQWD